MMISMGLEVNSLKIRLILEAKFSDYPQFWQTLLKVIETPKKKTEIVLVTT